MSLLTDLIAHWKLNEASGTRFDSHGSNDLTDNNTVTSATGKIGDAASFTSANQEYLSRSDNADLSVTGDFTIALWVKPSVSGTNRVYIGKTGEYVIWRVASNGIRFDVFDSSSGSVLFTTTATIAQDVWTFIVCWYDSADKKLRVQLNNATPEVSSTSLTNGPKDSTATFIVGALTASNFWNDGLIDSVSLWKRVLTSDERTALYNSGNGLDYDDFAGGLTLEVSDAISLSDANALGFGLVKSDSFSLDDARALLVGKSLSDSFTLADAHALNAGKVLSDSIVLDDAKTLEVAKVISDAISLSDTAQAIITLLLALEDSFTLSDSVAREIGKVLADALDLSDLVTKAFGKSIADSIDLADLVTKLLEGPSNDAIGGPNTLFFNDAANYMQLDESENWMQPLVAA